MKTKCLALTLLTTLSLPAFAANSNEGPYLVGLLGSTTKMSTSADGSSATGMIGYQVNEFFAVEGGMGLLFDNAAYTTTQTAGYTASSMAGSQFAALITFPILDELTFLMRVGGVSFERANQINGVTSELWEESWSGTLMGVGVQGKLPFDIGGVDIGLRAGIDRYSLSNGGTSTETPLNVYVGGMIYF
jgi:hypothetical protein